MQQMMRQIMWFCGAGCGVLLFAGACMAQSGRVSYPDGQPVVGAKVHIDLDGVEKFKASTDDRGRFVLPDDAFLNAMLQIKAADGKDFASVNLPMQLFAAGEVAIVLQPKK